MSSLVALPRRYYAHDFTCFLERMRGNRMKGKLDDGRAVKTELLRWASLRTQTLYRTIEGMMQARPAPRNAEPHRTFATVFFAPVRHI